MIWEAPGGNKRGHKRGPITFYPRVPQNGVTSRGMPNGADPCPFHLIVHLDRDRSRAEEKIANAYVGDVRSQQRPRGAKSASGEPDEDPSAQPGYGSMT